MRNGIHPIPPEDHIEFLRLSEFAFQYESNEEERQRKTAILKQDEMWGYYVEGNLAAKLMLLPLAVNIGERLFAMGGIASVSTWPEYRRNGFVGQLLKQSFRQMREAGQSLSMLSPFSYAFYRKYGYEIYTDVKTYELDLSLIPPLPDPAGSFERTRDVKLLREIYDVYSRRYSGMLARSEEWWDRLLEKRNSTIAVWRDKQGTPRGYIKYVIQQYEMKVHEWIYLDEEARMALLKWISQHDSMCGKVTMKAPADDALSFLLPNPRFKQEAAPYFMARIVDAEAFVRDYPFRSGGRTELFLNLEDTHADWNAGSFLLTVDAEGKGKLERVSTASDSGQTLSCTIQTLAALLMGYLSPTALLRMGRLSGDEDAARQLEDRLPGLTPYLTDFF
ncbi:GNAT family N-acetyltransferase [Gorillibacterium sp. CAU 1737]|uniref:GNAT family N-acetyltransferase n=1 Tax=Gorillibacterium sp. CAU 1737 TaxID=3140362 RepID=UPI00325FFEAA